MHCLIHFACAVFLLAQHLGAAQEGRGGNLRWRSTAVVAPQPQRRLTSSTSLPSCAGLRNTSASWKITCNETSCSNPLCPVGFFADVDGQSCSLAPENAPSTVYWEAPECVPWTVELRMFGSSSVSVDNLYQLSVQAIGADGFLSSEESRTVMLVLQRPDGFQSLWPVSLASGVGSVEINQTKATDAQLQLIAGSDFNEDVIFPELNVTFLPGASSSFSFAASSTAQGTVDSPVLIEVRAFDRYGNLATSEAGMLVTVAWQLVDNPSVGGSRPTSFQAGIGVAWVTSSTPGTYRLSLQNPVKVNIDASAELNMVLLPGAPVRFAFEASSTGAGGEIEAGAQAQVIIIVQDQHGNRATDVSEEVVALASSADGEIVANSTVNISVGEGTWRFTHTTAEVLTLSLSRVPDSLLDVDDVAELRVVPASARLIRITAGAGSISPVDAPIDVQLEAHDQYGNRATASAARVSIISPQVDELQCTFTPVVVQLAAGVGVSRISCQELGTMNISLQDSHGTGLAMGMPLEVTFVAGSAVAVEFTARSFVGTVGSWVTVTLQSVDLFGHVAPFGGSLTITTNGSATTSSMSDSGVVVLDSSGAGSLNWTSTVAEVLALSIMDTYSIGLDVSDEAIMVFAASSGTRFAFEGPSVVDTDVTSSFWLSVVALDIYGNIADMEQSDVTVIASSASAGTWSLGLVDISDGRGHITISSTTAGNITLSLSDTEGTGLQVWSTLEVVFQAGPAIAVAVAAQVSTGSVDEPLRVELQAVDVFGNLASLASKKFEVLASGTGQVDPTTVELQDGVGEASVSATAVGEVVVSLLDSGMTGLDVTSTLALTFTPGVPAQFGFLAPATAVVGEEANVTLITLDQYGNRAFASPGAAAVTLMASGAGELVPSGTASWNQAQGAASFGLRNTVAEEVTLSVVVAPTNALDASATWRLQFLPGPMQSFEFQGCPVFVLAGNAADVTLIAVDRFGNIVAGFSGQVQLTVSDATTPASLNVVSGQGELELRRADPNVVLLSVVGHADVSCNVSFVIDISPPVWDTLTVRAQASQAVVSVTGLSEPSTLWCVRVDPARGPPQLPPNNSNEAVFAALIGADPPVSSSSPNDDDSDNSSSGVSMSYAGTGTAVVTSTSTWALLQLQNLEPGTMYEVRCILADVVGNFASSVEVTDILAAEATSTAATTTPSSPGGNSGVASTSSSSSQPTGNDGGGHDEQEGVMWLLIFLAISIACVCGIPLSAAALWMCRRELNSFSERSSQKLQEGGFRWQEEQEESNFFHTRCNRFEDSELWDLRGSGRERYKDLLQEAYKMRQELMDDLQRHMAPLPRSSAQPDDAPEEDVETASDVQIGSPDLALLKDVHSFLQKPLYVDPDPMQVYVSRLPELRVSLTEDEQERIEAVLNLARAMWDGNWEDSLASFDKAWKDVEGELWQATRSQVRADQVRYHQAKLDASTALQQLEASVGQQWDQSELHLLEALVEEERKFNEETDVHIKALKGLAARWPKDAADRRSKLVKELTSPSAEPDMVEDGQQQHLRPPPPPPQPRSIRSAIAKLRELRWSQEDKLDAEIRRLEKFGNGRVEVVRKEQVARWEEQCKKLDAEAAELRGEIAGKKRTVASLCHQAEQAAAHAIVGVWQGLRHTAVERDVRRELSDLEEQIQVHRRRVINATESKTEEASQERSRGLCALDRTASLARQWVADEKQRRLAHWSRAAELRGREHLRAAQRRHVDAERRLKDDMARVEEVAADAQAKRRYGLTIGSGHQAEVAKLTISAAARHGRIVMGLEAAAATNAAEEHMWRETQQPGMSNALPNEDWSSISSRWKGGSFAEELSAIAAKVAEALSKHNYQQRSLLLQTQRRQAILARMPEGEDQQREDILDALEECMNREIRAVRVAFQAGSAVAAVTRGDGEATELGRSLASVHRHTEVLVSEAEIGNRYDRLRALVLAGGEMTEEEAAACAAVQLEVQELEKQALELRALALDDPDGDNEGEDAEEMERQSISKAKQRQQESSLQRMASQVEYLNAACEQESAKQAQLEASLQAREEKMKADVATARELIAEGQMENAMQLLAMAVQGDKVADASLDREMSDLLEEVHHGSEAIEVAATEAKETLRRTRSARQRRRESAEIKAKELLEVGLPDEAMIVAMSFAQEIEAEEAQDEAKEELAAEKALDTETSEAERARLFASFMDHKAQVQEITAAEIERHRQRSQERRAERRKKIQAALQLAEASDSEQEGVQTFFEAVRALERAARESLQPSKERFQARRAARQRRRETAEQKSRELQAQGFVEDAVKQLEEAANELAEFFGEDSIAAADQGSRKQRELAEEQDRLKAELATRRARIAEDNRRSEAEEQARALEARAAELRTTANLMLMGSGAESDNAVDAVQEWQEEARRRAVAGSAWAGGRRKQQAVRQRNAQMANARERIKSRQQSRKAREEAASLKPLGHAAHRVHKVVEQQLRPVMHMKRLMRHRRGPLLQRHRRDMELLRAEYEAKLRALEKRLRKDGQQEEVTNQMSMTARGGGFYGAGSHAEPATENRRHSGAKGRVHAAGEQARTAAMSMKVNVKSITKQLSRVSNIISTSLDDSTYVRSRRRPTTSDDVEEIALDSVGPLASTANEPQGLPLERQDSEESIPTTFLDHGESKGNPGASSPRKAWGM